MSDVATTYVRLYVYVTVDYVRSTVLLSFHENPSCSLPLVELWNRVKGNDYGDPRLARFGWKPTRVTSVHKIPASREIVI